jgi:hypothetical protein
VRWGIVVDEAGILRVDRRVIRGPDPISRFDIR